MASPAILATLVAGLTVSAPGVGGNDQLVLSDGDCAAAVAQVVAETGGQLLSAQPSGDSCVITVLVQGNGSERPRKVRVKVPM
ncbi:hypothetical protein DEM27_03170 [Metarhizobium album]|uniref:Uncharacterized protein n=1 Tax=Metarhizobium album TaxID=2182425 RepID=A0A2U2DXZ5_9HYPH|nr:hypothetical protein [Rhizobium album]PWE58194.1 hypothetical protein DEM27_03170 [Rhizobium album]